MTCGRRPAPDRRWLGTLRSPPGASPAPYRRIACQGGRWSARMDGGTPGDVQLARTYEEIVTIRVGINGFGRIGRNFFRAVAGQGADIEIVAVNDLTDTATLAHLLKYDASSGRFPAEVERAATSSSSTANIKVFAERDPARLPGATSASTSSSSRPASSPTRPRPRRTSTAAPRRSSSPPRPKRGRHDRAWASTTTTTTRRAHVISNASCTTNCLGPDGQGPPRRRSASQGPDDHDPRLHQDQNLQDAPHKDLRRARAAAINVVPTPPAPPRPSAWCCPSSRASSTASRCACRSRPARPPT